FLRDRSPAIADGRRNPAVDEAQPAGKAGETHAVASPVPSPPARPAAPPAPSAGVSCAPIEGCDSPQHCLDGCSTCEWVGGNWSCSRRPCGSSVCRTSRPLDGTFCSAEGQLCGSFANCGPTCRCVSNRWKCSIPDCALECPPNKPAASFGW